MKKLMMIGTLCIALTACNNTKTEDIELAKKAMMDSINKANELQVIKQRTIDSMNQVAAEQQHHSNVQATTQSNNEPTVKGKKKMSNKTKGALIGTGAGVVAGAVIGGIISKENPVKGAVVGGAVGGAVGSGVGYGAGAAKDKKAAETKTTNP